MHKTFAKALTALSILVLTLQATSVPVAARTLIAYTPNQTLVLLPSPRTHLAVQAKAALTVEDIKPTPTPTPIPAVKGATTVKPDAIDSSKLTVVVDHQLEPSDTAPLYEKYGAMYGIDPVMLQKIASCESGERANAVNGPYAGMFQFVAATWSSNRRAMGEDPDPALRYNAEEAVKTAAFKMSRDGYGAWPSCSRKALRQLGQ